MVIYLKGISEEGLLFNGNVKVINASLKFLIQVAIKKGNSISTKIKFT